MEQKDLELLDSNESPWQFLCLLSERAGLYHNSIELSWIGNDYFDRLYQAGTEALQLLEGRTADEVKLAAKEIRKELDGDKDRCREGEGLFWWKDSEFNALDRVIKKTKHDCHGYM